MKRVRFTARPLPLLLPLLLACACAASISGQEGMVLTGIDVLQLEGFAPLKGRKVGLITNHTGRDRSGHSTIQILHGAKELQLLALFSPEHGLQGKLEGKVKDQEHEETGLPIRSLYGQTRKPQAKSLVGIDTLVFDIQDIGCRYYTYISTMGLAMQAAAEHKLRFVVLDRPNPIGGQAVAGPMLDAGKEDFVGWHDLPIRHGMTAGELAGMFNEEKKIGCDLHVVQMRHWQRSQLYDATGLYWVNPSPNMRSLTQALLYPGVGLLETTNISVGRGTDTPFEVVGAPWLDGRALALALNRARIPGTRCTPIRFTPDASVFENKACSGIRIQITDHSRFDPLVLGMHLACTIRQLYGADWKVEEYGRLLRNDAVLAAIKKGTEPEVIVQNWQDGLGRFLERRQRFLLYD